MSSLGENPELVFESQVACAGAGKAAVPSAAKVTSPRAIHDLFERGLTAIEVVVDWLTVVLAVEGAFIASQLLRAGGISRPAFNMAPYVPFAVATLVVLLLDRDGAYRAGNSLLRIKETERSLRVSVQAFALILPIAFLVGGAVPRAIFVVAIAGVPSLQILEKQLFFLGVRALRERGYGVRNVLIYGAGESGRRVFSALVRSPRLGLNPVALVDDDATLEGQDVFASGYRRRHAVRIVAGPVTKQLLERHACALFVIAIPGLEAERFSRAVKAAEAVDATVTFLPRDSGFSLAGIEHADIDGILLNVMGKPEMDWNYEITKCVFDRVTATALLILIAPAWLAIALIVRFDSPGPVLFRHERVGMRGRFFTLYKFRSMYLDTPQYDISPRTSSDARITRIGRFLRRSSLDELPQLLNVVRGEMSLVGPRPEMPFVVSKYSASQRRRLDVRPGITGLWQISADRAFQIHENIHYDHYYLRHRSIFLDLAILLHTVVVAMRGI